MKHQLHTSDNLMKAEVIELLNWLSNTQSDTAKPTKYTNDVSVEMLFNDLQHHLAQYSLQITQYPKFIHAVLAHIEERGTNEQKTEAWLVNLVDACQNSGLNYQDVITNALSDDDLLWLYGNKLEKQFQFTDITFRSFFADRLSIKDDDGVSYLMFELKNDEGMQVFSIDTLVEYWMSDANEAGFACWKDTFDHWFEETYQLKLEYNRGGLQP